MINEEEESEKSSGFRRALSVNLMKYQEMEKILAEITREKNKLGKSLQKLVNLHKNELKVFKEAKNFKIKSKKINIKSLIFQEKYIKYEELLINS